MLNGKSIKFGVSIGQERVSWPELKEAVGVIEESGFDSLWCHDHLIPSDPGRNEGTCFEAWALLGAYAMMTKNITIGPMVSGNTYRNPVLLAKSATTVDMMSNGRLIFGIGAGWFEKEHIAYGFPFYSTRERIDRMEESINLIKTLWTSDRPVNFSGKYYSLDNAPFDPKPFQTPHPPILIAGGGEKHTLRVVARWADMMNVYGTPELASRKYRILESHCKDIGRDPKHIEKSVNVALIPPEKMADWDDYIKTLKITMPSQAQAKIDGAVVGNMDNIRDWIRGHAEAGTQHIIFTMRAPYPLDSLRTLAKTIVPQFK